MKPYTPLPLLAALAALAPAVGGQNPKAAPPLRHIVVIFQENVSFDHYFGAYPRAANPPGEPPFLPAPHTPSVAGYDVQLLTRNPNALNPANGIDAVNPFRLDRAQAATADQDHRYTQEQKAVDGGKMDLFPATVGNGGKPPGAIGPLATKGLTMGYFDGNTVTAFWNYAQRFSISDHFFDSIYGPSTPGALDLVSGQTNGANHTLNGTGSLTDGGAGSLTAISDSDPIGDICSAPTHAQFSMGGRNVGDLLNTAGVSWGFFQGGFDLSLVNPNGTTGCLRSTHSDITGKTEKDYVPHHEPFQYYAATANLQHLRPTSVAAIGKQGDAANHQYDVNDFFAAVAAGNFPQVSYLKAPAYANGHAGNSDPLDEQAFVVHVINFLQTRPEWRDTAVIIAYDDSDGWYDHLMAPLVNPSAGPADALTGPGACGDGERALPGIDPANLHARGRCGYGPRLPLIVVSPWARRNHVDSTVTDQTSILRLIEDTFLHGQRIGQGSFDSLAGPLDNLFDFARKSPSNLQPLRLDETTGEPLPR